MDCLELRLSEIVRVALYASADTTVPIPANINAPFIPVAYLSLPASPVIALALSPSSDTEAMLDATPSLKVTNALSPAGNIYTHELQLSVAQNPTTVRAAVDALVGRDFHILYTLQRQEPVPQRFYQRENAKFYGGILATISQHFVSLQSVRCPEAPVPHCGSFRNGHHSLVPTLRG